MTAPPGPQRSGEMPGFLLSLGFASLAAVRDVYLGGLFQRVHPIFVAVTAFALCTLVFLPVALVRDPGGLAALARRPTQLVWVNGTTAVAWLSFFFALRTIEPALVQVLFYGVGPLSVWWVDGLVPGVARATLGRAERGLHLALLGSLICAAAVVLGGRSGLGPQPAAVAAAGIGLAIGGGISISICTLLCRALNDAGVHPAALLPLRFPGAIVLAGAVAMASPLHLTDGVTPGVLAGVAVASFLLIVVPNYVNQLGVALASPVTVRAVLALSPVQVFALQLLEARLSPSAATLTVCALYAVCALAVAGLRRQKIAAGPPRSAGAPQTSRTLEDCLAHDEGLDAPGPRGPDRR